MKFFIAVAATLFFAYSTFAQQPMSKNPRPELRKGNELYGQKKYKEAQGAYQNALRKDPSSFAGMFNLGDALYQDQQYESARQVMAAGLKSAASKKEQASLYHNIGNTFLKEKHWEEAINAYKQALRLNPSDTDTKYNLAYAQAMLQKNGGNNKDKNSKDKNQDKKDQDKKENDKDKQDEKQQGDQQKNEGKDKKEDQNNSGREPGDDQDKKDDKKQQPAGQPSKLSKEQAENLLNALRQEEKKLQDKKDKAKGVPVRLEKDW